MRSKQMPLLRDRSLPSAIQLDALNDVEQWSGRASKLLQQLLDDGVIEREAVVGHTQEYRQAQALLAELRELIEVIEL